MALLIGAHQGTVPATHRQGSTEMEPTKIRSSSPFHASSMAHKPEHPRTEGDRSMPWGTAPNPTFQGIDWQFEQVHDLHPPKPTCAPCWIDPSVWNIHDVTTTQRKSFQCPRNQSHDGCGGRRQWLKRPFQDEDKSEPKWEPQLTTRATSQPMIKEGWEKS